MDPGTIVADQLHGVGVVAEEVLVCALGDSAEGLRVVARELRAVNVRVTQVVILESRSILVLGDVVGRLVGEGAIVPAVRMQCRSDVSLTVVGGIRGPGIRVTVQGHEGTDCLLGGIAASLQHVLQRHPGIA
jgi:hypothetical protein